MPTKNIDEVEESIEITKEIIRISKNINEDEKRIKKMKDSIRMMEEVNKKRRDRAAALEEKRLTVGRFFEIEHNGKIYPAVKGR